MLARDDNVRGGYASTLTFQVPLKSEPEFLKTAAVMMKRELSRIIHLSVGLRIGRNSDVASCAETLRIEKSLVKQLPAVGGQKVLNGGRARLLGPDMEGASFEHVASILWGGGRVGRQELVSAAGRAGNRAGSEHDADRLPKAPPRARAGCDDDL